MAQVGEVVFALERFELSAEERLEVVGRWEGLEGRRLGRPALTVIETSGRRRRLNALPGGQLSSTAWRASFAWEGDVAAIESAELELGRKLVVELPAPRRRRRRSASTGQTGSASPSTNGVKKVEAARPKTRDAAVATASAAELETLSAERDALQAELEPLRTEVETLRAEAAANRMEMSSLEERLQRARDGIVERDQKLMTLQESIDVAVEQATADAAKRVDTARAEAAELRTKLAEAREQSELARTEMAAVIAAEAAETEQMRAQLKEARDTAEQTVAAERAETAKLREELAARPTPAVAVATDPASEDTTQDQAPSARRMLDRVNRDLERERAQNRALRRDLETVQGELAEVRRHAAMSAAATVEGPSAVLKRPGPAHRVDVARAAGAHLIPDHHLSPVRLWGARLVAAVLVALLLIALALIVVPLL